MNFKCRIKNEVNTSEIIYPSFVEDQGKQTLLEKSADLLFSFFILCHSYLTKNIVLLNVIPSFLKYTYILNLLNVTFAVC